MKKRIAIKIIGGAIIFSFAMFFLSGILPSKASAASSTGLNWDNPNASGNNPYKFKPADVLNSQLIMQVVGCTGVVDKVSAAVIGFVQGQAGKAAAAALKKKTNDAIKAAAVKSCDTSKKVAVGAASGTTLNVQEVPKLINCQDIQNAKDQAAIDELITTRQAEAAAKTRDECFNGIAITLAKNQLTAMTKYTMNWVNSGFSGNPMYVQDITTLTNNISKDAINSGVLELTKTDKAYPYGASFSTAIINNYKSEGALVNGVNNFLSSMTSTLGNFITDPQSLSFTATTPDRRTPAQKAKDLNASFANDFSLGGWDGWLGLTMNEANNPLGFSMKVSQYLTDQANTKQEATKNEVAQNNGFLSQKKCSLYNDADKVALTKTLAADQKIADEDCYTYGEDSNECLSADNMVEQDQLKITSFVRTCVTWDVVTPGSLIKDKVSTYVNSPERQLELADTINKSLNSLFAALITKFQDQGLSGLSSEKYQYTSTDMGGGPGTDNIDLFSSATGGSGYSNGSFDLTHDLGNQFIHGYKIDPIGTWNAKINEPQLAIEVAPLMDDGKTPWDPNVFYIVKNGVDSNGKGIVGQTKLFENGYNNWENGDRAFWDGTEWQNWKKTTVDKNGIMLNTSPIAKRGVIQIQKDYVVAAKQILMALPAVMPQIGELDYCIPGPNPNFQGISADTSALFSDYASSITATFKKGSLFARKSNTYSIATYGDPQFDDYFSVFKLTDYSWWQKVTQTDYWNRLLAYGHMGTVKGSQSKLDGIQQGVDDYLEKINTDTKIFYDVYAQYIDKTYGPNSLMQTQFFQREDTPDMIPNPAWLPMASEGLDITKNIVAYNDDIISTADDYKDSIIKANANISSLNEIKDKVSAIIKAAQGRRDAKLLETLKQEAIDNNGPVLTEAQYKEKYKNCLAEEDIVYYDDLSIMGIPPSEANRCNDGLDNDLDGLVDDLDPDCNGNKVNPPVVYACVTDLTEDSNGEIFMQNDSAADPMPEDTDPCTMRTASNCTASLYYSSGMGMKCKAAGN